jgi:hypothetical protein
VGTPPVSNWSLTIVVHPPGLADGVAVGTGVAGLMKRQRCSTSVRALKPPSCGSGTRSMKGSMASLDARPVSEVSLFILI